MSRLCQPTGGQFSAAFEHRLPAKDSGLKACRMHKIKSAVLLAFLLTGCTSVEGDFPSLSKRPYETDDPLAEPVVAAAPVTTELPADLRAQTDALVARARKAHAAFEAALPAARSAAQSASGAVSGSEAWVNGHMVISRADGARADAVEALSELDRLVQSERDKGADSGLIALLAVPQGQIGEIVNAETAEIDRLSNMIGI
jgi:hypothetical protein